MYSNKIKIHNYNNVIYRKQKYFINKHEKVQTFLLFVIDFILSTFYFPLF